MQDATTLRLEIERRYDGGIPPDALAAIAAAEQAEREAHLTAHLSPEALLRFRAAKEFRLAKGCFRTLARLTRDRMIRPLRGERRSTFQALRDRARLAATPHLEALAALRQQEKRQSRAG